MHWLMWGRPFAQNCGGTIHRLSIKSHFSLLGQTCMARAGQTTWSIGVMSPAATETHGVVRLLMTVKTLTISGTKLHSAAACWEIGGKSFMTHWPICQSKVGRLLRCMSRLIQTRRHTLYSLMHSDTSPPRRSKNQLKTLNGQQWFNIRFLAKILGLADGRH